MAESSTEQTPLAQKVRPGQIELAKLKVYLDERLGKETPQIIKEIAKLSKD